MEDNMMFDYLLQMGAMRPEQDELKRKQALVDALRGNALDPMQGQMIGKHYVGGGLAGALGKLGQAYFAKQGQQGVDTGLQSMNERQRKALEDLRKRRQGGFPAPAEAGYADPYSNLPTYGNEA